MIVRFILAVVFLIPLFARADLWTTAYYPGYRQSSMAASNVDFSVLSHIIHFSLIVNSDGTLNTSDNSITTANSSDLVSRTHAAGKKILICVAGGETAFSNATSTATLSLFITNLVNFMASRNYDGVDLDWEPLTSPNTTRFANLVNGLRTALDARSPRPLLTAAIYNQPTLLASLQSKFDQINLMTYSMSGAYGGWVTWFNAPLYNGGYRFPSTGGLVPSADVTVTSFINAGVAPGKLAIGIAFYGLVWSGGGGTSTGGAALPLQSWTSTNAPATASASFNTIMSTYYQSNLYHWDTNAQSAYLTMDNAGSTNDKFISYDDEHTCQAKVSFARNRGLGGVMIWELSQGYRSSQPAGKRDPLLQAIKQSLATPRLTGIAANGPNVTVSFSSLPLALYRVQWTTNLASGLWNTVTNNVSGPGGVMQVSDPTPGYASATFLSYPDAALSGWF